MHLSQKLLDNFQDLIYRGTSLRFSPARLKSLEVQILERVNTVGLNSCEDYLRLLQEDFEEFDLLIGGITTKETHFFRLPGQFKALAEHVIPEVEESLSKESQRLIAKEGWSDRHKVHLRIWSAGCATGEEPYSIAMIVMDSLKYPRAWEIDIMATDISKKALEIAGTGFYENKIIKKIPAFYKEKYIQVVHNGAVIVNQLSEKISFYIFNLSNLNPEQGNECTFLKLNGRVEYIDIFERFDIIFCRNVMIYFDFPAQQQLVDNLYACLKPGGYLFTGDAELLRIYKHCFRTLDYEGAYFYQKPDINKETLKERR